MHARAPFKAAKKKNDLTPTCVALRTNAQVRSIQNGKPQVSPFPYEVARKLAPGDTCTAYDHCNRIIHRGVVLDIVDSSSSYIVQFERKELGVKYIADTEVARHGQTTLIKKSTDPLSSLSLTSQIGQILRGTSNGPLLNNTRLQNAAYFRMVAMSNVLSNRMKEEEGGGDGGGADNDDDGRTNTLPTLESLSEEVSEPAKSFFLIFCHLFFV